MQKTKDTIKMLVPRAGVVGGGEISSVSAFSAGGCLPRVAEPWCSEGIFYTHSDNGVHSLQKSIVT